MKEINYLASYLEGVLNMASTLSTSIGPSYVKVDCYEKKIFQEEFRKNYKLLKEVEIIESKQSLESTLLNWFQGEKNIVESINYWFNLKYYGEKKVLFPTESLISQLNEKKMDFFFLEDIFFVDCNQYRFVFLLGNNE